MPAASTTRPSDVARAMTTLRGVRCDPTFESLRGLALVDADTTVGILDGVDVVRGVVVSDACATLDELEDSEVVGEGWREGEMGVLLDGSLVLDGVTGKVDVEDESEGDVELCAGVCADDEVGVAGTPSGDVVVAWCVWVCVCCAIVVEAVSTEPYSGRH